jgi:hypothetical protein
MGDEMKGMMKRTGAQYRISGKQCIALFSVTMAFSVYGQAGGQADPGSRVLELSSAPTQSEVMREIDDPYTGNRWLLMRNNQNPGGPGRLVLVDHPDGLDSASRQIAAKTEKARFLPVIHAGDRLIVEEHTAVADAILEARALNSAVLGSEFGVRLTIGGKVMRAIALGPGRAAFQAETGVRP